MSTAPITTRFAPSPTGYMHIGNLRTALYSYLISKHENGKFILRIEDTDRERLVEGATDVILSTLKTTGLNYDEGPIVGGPNGPYVQSERKEIYKEYAEQLVKMGAAYYCFCTKDRLDRLHEDTTGGGYDRHCRDLSPEEVAQKLAEGTPYVIRQKMPLEGKTSYVDAVFGEITTDNAELQDQILLKADGYPTYNFCHVVDDHLMGVTHVVRGSEYLTSTPKYALLYDAYGWERPVYVHLPLLMGKNEDGSVSKLSKRHGSVSFQDLIAQGYLPEAVLNYIALLGWCPTGAVNEFYSIDELIAAFTIDGISKSPSVFDFDKLLWFNGEYIKKLSPERFEELVTPYIKSPLPSSLNRRKMLALLHPRLSCLSDVEEKIAFLLALPEYETDLFLNKKNKVTLELAKETLAAALPALTDCVSFDNDSLYAALLAVSEKLGCKSGAVMWSVRIAVAGMAVTPGGATEIMEVLGREESLRRLQVALDKLAD